MHNNYDDGETALQKQIETKNELEIVNDLIADLSEQQRVIVQLREVEQKEYAEIAQILDMNETAVRVNLSRARKILRTQMLNIHNYGLASH